MINNKSEKILKIYPDHFFNLNDNEIVHLQTHIHFLTKVHEEILNDYKEEAEIFKKNLNVFHSGNANDLVELQKSVFIPIKDTENEKGGSIFSLLSNNREKLVSKTNFKKAFSKIIEKSGSHTNVLGDVRKTLYSND